MTALMPVEIRAPQLTDDERRLAERLLAKISGHERANAKRAAYYDGPRRVRDLGIAIPPHLRNLEAVIGWPGMAVDVLNERLRHDGWVMPGQQGDAGIGEIVEANKLRREFRVGRRAALKYGIAFGVAGAGEDGEPNPLVTVESPRNMTVTWDRRRRGVREALLVNTNDQGETTGATLWTMTEVLDLRLSDGRWTVVTRGANRIGRPPIVRLVNRYDENADGRSEITPALRTATDNAVRTLVAMEVSRDFFAAPKFWLLGADESSFVGPDGQAKTAWETYIGRLNAIERDEEGNVPDVKTWQGASPAPFVEQLRMLAQLVAAESALPISYLGLVHDANPASADAALIAEARLNIRAEERMEDFGEDEGELMRFALWIREGADPGVTPRPNYRPAATPTLAAAADRATKLVGSGILPPDSEVTLEQVGLNETERDRVLDDRRRARARGTLDALAAAAETARQDPDVADLTAVRG